MKNNEIIDEIVYPAIDLANKTLPKSKMLKKSPDTILYGQNGTLDSIELVSLILSLEDLIQKRTKKAIRLVSKAAMSRTRSPFHSVEILGNYIMELLNGKITGEQP